MTDPFGVLRDAKTIAIVGASPSPDRESHGVMRYLLNHGYRCIPVRPDCNEVLGVPCVSTLRDIDESIDLVDVFRRPGSAPVTRVRQSPRGRRRSGFSSGSSLRRHV
jgi:predicted CoA-binding protein